MGWVTSAAASRHDICQNFYPTGVFGAKTLHILQLHGVGDRCRSKLVLFVKTFAWPELLAENHKLTNNIQKYLGRLALQLLIECFFPSQERQSQK